MLYFITGNKNKFQEFEAILGKGTIEQLSIDLDEIQEINPHKIIRHKLQEALKHHKGPILIEDTSLCMECLGGNLPGPLIKRFDDLGIEGLYELAKNSNKYNARTTTLIGYAKNENEIEFFEGTLEGKIVEPIHKNDFGRGPIFHPNGQEKSYGAMTKEEKNEISMRRIALNKLRNFLEKK